MYFICQFCLEYERMKDINFFLRIRMPPLCHIYKYSFQFQICVWTCGGAGKAADYAGKKKWFVDKMSTHG